MSYKNYLAILFIILGIISSHGQFISQQDNFNPISDGYLNYVNNNGNNKDKVDLATVKGSPYEAEEFILGNSS